MAEWPELETGEELVGPAQELLWRNVNPGWIDENQLSKQAFLPFPKDEDRLSCARESKVTAADHHAEFTDKLGYASVGVWAVSTRQVSDAGLRSVDDSAAPGAPAGQPQGHTFVDYRGVQGGGAKKRLASHLRNCAEELGRQYP